MTNVGTLPQLCAKCGMYVATSMTCVHGLLLICAMFSFPRSGIWIPQFALMDPGATAAEDTSTEGAASPTSVQQQEKVGESKVDEWGGLFRAPKDASSFYRFLVGSFGFGVVVYR